MNRPRTRTRELLATVLAVAVLLVTGCVSVPTSGPVVKVEGQPPSCLNCVNVEVAPPAPDDDPRQIVEGFVRAMSNYQASYSVARQFLSATAAEKWTPDAGVTIYTGTLSARGARVSLTQGRQVGVLDKYRSYTATGQKFEMNLRLVKNSAGEWRIDNPTPGLVITENAFTSFYQAYNLYYLSKGDGDNPNLVPNPIYLPSVGNQANLASALMKALLVGPPDNTAVNTAAPPNTTLKVDSVTISADGIAEVPLSDTVLALSDPARAQLAAQIVYTLKQLSSVKGVVVTVNGSRLKLPQSDPTTMVVATTAIADSFDPVPAVASAQLYTARNDTVEVTEPNFEQTTPLDGLLGTDRWPIEALAVSATNTDIALVTDRRTALRVGQVTSGDVRRVGLGRVHRLLRPQISRYGELWAVGDVGGRQRMWVVNGTQVSVVDTAVLDGGRVTAFRVSPDGTRIAMVRQTTTGSELGIAQVNRADQTSVDHWQVLNLRQTSLPQVSRMLDVGWVDATNLMVLGAASRTAAVAPYRISMDALSISQEGEQVDWDATEITLQLHTQLAVIRGGDGQTWRDNGTQWLGFGRKGAAAVAYPG